MAVLSWPTGFQPEIAGFHPKKSFQSTLQNRLRNCFRNYAQNLTKNQNLWPNRDSIEDCERYHFQLAQDSYFRKIRIQVDF